MALFFLSLKKSSKILIISPQVPFWGSSTNHLPCHTLSKTLEISRILIFDKSMMYTKNNKVTKWIFVMLQRKHQPKTNDDRLKQLFDFCRYIRPIYAVFALKCASCDWFKTLNFVRKLPNLVQILELESVVRK